MYNQSDITFNLDFQTTYLAQPWLQYFLFACLVQKIEFSISYKSFFIANIHHACKLLGF